MSDERQSAAKFKEVLLDHYKGDTRPATLEQLSHVYAALTDLHSSIFSLLTLVAKAPFNDAQKEQLVRTGEMLVATSDSISHGAKELLTLSQKDRPHE